MTPSPILRVLPREALLAPNFWRFSPPIPQRARPPTPERALPREPGLPETELPVLWQALDWIAAHAVVLGRDEWRDIAFAVHWATGGSAEGLERMLAFSQAAPGWDEEAEGRLTVIWDGADERRAGGITAATVFKMAARIEEPLSGATWVNPATVLAAVPDPDEWGVVAGPTDPEEAAREEREQEAIRARNAARAPIAPMETEAERHERQRKEHKRIGEDGWRDELPTQRIMSGTEMLSELVYIGDGSRVSFLDDPRHVQTFTELKAFTAGSFDVARGRAGRAGAKVLRAQRWLESPDRKTVRVQTFAPGRGRLCDSPEGVQAQNLWTPRPPLREQDLPPTWREMVAAFLAHVEYLVPMPEERERLLDWIAHIEQRPGELPSTHYLMVTKQTGIGRNWLAYALSRCFAGWTALGFNLAASLSSGFNGALSMKLLAVVDELHEGGPSRINKPAEEALKSMLTEETRRINPKYGRQHTEYNACRFLMLSNHDSALPLAEHDRRVIVLANPVDRMSPDYYTRLYQMLYANGLGDALAWWAQGRDISAFNPGALAPMNKAKERSIRAGRSELEQAVRDVAEEWPSDVITSAELQRAVSDALGGHAWNIQSAGVSAGLVKYKGRVKVAGVAAHVWILRRPERWADALPGDIAAEVRRGGEENFADLW